MIWLTWHFLCLQKIYVNEFSTGSQEHSAQWYDVQFAHVKLMTQGLLLTMRILSKLLDFV